MQSQAVLLDRDGTILVERGHVTAASELALLPGSATAIQQLRADGYKVLVVTNQSHIAKGQITENALNEIHRAFERLLLDAGTCVDGIYYCPHHPEGLVPDYTFVCECRKPRPGLLLRAAVEHDIDLRRSVLVGDALRDLQAGQAAHVGANILVRTGHGAAVEALPHNADHVADDLASAVQWIRHQLSRS
jgi:D-glycero-D-manno-heptose 1,7-bisphosphate phosphatase